MSNPNEVNMKAITLQEARSLGLKTYYSGVPCKYNHLSERSVSGRRCLQCKREQNNKYMADYRANKTDEDKASDKKYLAEYHQDNKAKNNQRNSIRYQENRSTILAQAKIYASENKDKINARHRERYKNDEEYRAGFIVRTLLRRVLIATDKTKQTKTTDILGYNGIDLINYITPMLTDGMGWDNYGEWEIDHIKPLSWFVREGETSPTIINALSNLKPLWRVDNRSKSNLFIG
jgi:hypothetical protein